mmetsp:Transcript_7725/g.19887  ORF Transcript_7725/g.19887 Transcript_7725/m.19887 type:complete len:686 (-) Transcript_7725:82-2139(-)
MAEEGAPVQPAESPLPPAILRSLGDRSYDKRKNAALEIEALIKALQENNDTDRICSVIAMLGQDFATSTNANHRKGGLIGLAATAIGLMQDIHLYLDALLPPVLHCFDDPESRVRYYSCESLYNIAKVARGHILKYFNQIFDGLCKLFADVDVDVKNGANLLDRLIKDIVTESESFDVERFIPLLQKYIRRTNPYIRQLLVGWITVLDSVPDINMLDWLPDFLDGLFNMLSDGNREIRQAAESALAEFLRETKQSAVVEFGPMVSILVSQCNSKERFNRLTAITWVHEFINLGRDRLLLFYSELLGAIMHCISDSDPEIRGVAGQTNQDLLVLVNETTKDFELSPLLQTLTRELTSHHIPTRMATLRWIDMLLEKAPQDMNKFIGELLPALLKTLSDEADEVVLMNLKVLARISLHEVEFQRVLNAIVELFLTDRRLLETRGSLIIRKLCVLLNAKSIYISLAAVLRKTPDLEFASIMVQTLNLILLTALELTGLRHILKSSFQESASSEDRAVFTALFNCWSHNPVATLSLCLLAQAYGLASALVQKFAEVEITVGFLMQIDKLVQLLESPIFIQLRLQLLEVDAPYHPALLKSLYGLLMLLPQSTAFRTLSDRLATVSSLQQHLGGGASRAAQGKAAKPDEYTSLLLHFEQVQERHSRARQDALQNRSLHALGKAETSEAKSL